MKYLYDTYSHIGSRRSNQDSYAVCIGENGFAALVADGLGGYSGGELASKICIETVENAFEKTDNFSLDVAITEANENILQMQQELDNAMKTTAAAVWIGKKETVFANVGDSRLYAFKDGRIVFQSIDHSVAQMCVDCGEITPDQIRDHDDRCILTRSLGGKQYVGVDTVVAYNDDYDSLLICSDGFWEYVYEDEMCEARKSSQTPQQWLEKMRKCREDKVGMDNDNNTAVVVIIEEE